MTIACKAGAAVVGVGTTGWVGVGSTGMSVGVGVVMAMVGVAVPVDGVAVLVVGVVVPGMLVAVEVEVAVDTVVEEPPLLAVVELLQALNKMTSIAIERITLHVGLTKGRRLPICWGVRIPVFPSFKNAGCLKMPVKSEYYARQLASIATLRLLHGAPDGTNRRGPRIAEIAKRMKSEG